MLRFLVATSLLFLVTSSSAEERSCVDELAVYPSTAKAKQCAIEMREPTESRLNLTYKDALKSVGQRSDSRLTKSRFEQEQLSWKKYRDAHCKLDALYPKPADATALELVCIAEMNDCRVEYLREIFFPRIEGKDDGEAPINCVGR